MLRPGSERQRLARTLGAAYADGLLSQETFAHGRSSSCDVVLSEASVSRRHVRLHYRDGRWVLHDLNSTNGTSVNGARVGRCEIRPGDRLVLGNEQLQID